MLVNGENYEILRLLGHGKGGYSYLAQCGGTQVVVKQIHHEPCDYYSFGNKLEAELRDYERLRQAGIRVPEMLAVDTAAERIVGAAVYDMYFGEGLCAIAPDGDPAAYCCVWYRPDTDYAYEEPVCTVPAHRGKGVASALLSEALNRARALGAKEAWVISDLPFYKKLGFTEELHALFYWK